MKKYNLPFCFVLAILILSCGTRKTNKEYSEIKSNYSFNDSSYILTQNVRLNNIGKLIPIDNNRSFFVDGKEYFNVSIEFDNSVFENFELNQTYTGTVNGKSEIIDNEQTDKTDNTILWIGIAFIVCLFVFLFLYLPKLKI